MRPYLAMLRDSFHEALVSRVLWILLLLTTVFLLALVPLGVTQQAGSFLTPTDLPNPTAFLNKVAEQAKSGEPSPGRRVWELLSKSLQAKISGRQDPTANFEATYALRNELNELLKRPDFYDAKAWQNIKLPHEAELLQEHAMAADEQARFNRLALQAAFPDEIARGHRKQIQLTYFHWELGLPLPLEREQLHPAINSILVAMMVYLLGVGGVLIAILVTASLIPQTFEPGAIDLLLSKPNMRVLVFLTKFVGGCAFTLVNATYFIIALWLIVGVRFGLWNAKLLWCIPVYMFLFAIYYSVSALAGVFWRNAVLSVVMVIVFWLVCWSLGLAKNLVELLALNPQRITRLTPAGDSLLGVNESGEVLQWQQSDQVWQRMFFDENSSPVSPFKLDNSLVGPIYQASEDRLLAVQPVRGRFGSLSSTPLLWGSRAEQWQRNEGAVVPSGVSRLFVTPTGEVVAAAPRGLYKLSGDMTEKQPQINIFGLKVPLPQKGGRFVEASPSLQLSAPISVAMDPKSGDVAFYDTQSLVVCDHKPDGQYEIRKRIELTGDRAAVLAFGGGVLLLAEANGTVQFYDPTTLEPREELQPQGGNAPRAATTSADGRYVAVVFHNRELWLYDTEKKLDLSSSIGGQGEISAVAFTGDKFFVVDDLTRASEYEIGSWKVAAKISPAMGPAEAIYRYVIWPVYTIFPKPSQLDATISYLLTDEESTPLRPARQDLTSARIKLDVWGPLWSNLAFLCVMLGFASFYIHRKDF